MSEICLHAARPMAAGENAVASYRGNAPRSRFGFRFGAGRRKAPAGPKLSDHLLKDIGISHADLAALTL